MPAPELSFELYRGDDQIIEVTVRDKAGAVVSLVGATMRWWWSKINATTGVWSTTPNLQKAAGTGVTVIDPSNGRVNLIVVSTDTRTLAPADYHHELEVVDSLGRVRTVLQGTISLLKDLVTNP